MVGRNRLCCGILLALVAESFGLHPASVAADDESSKSARPTGKNVQILVAYDTLRGNTEEMAKAVAIGVKRVKGAVPIVKKVGDVTKEDLDAADGIILGSPTYYANIAGTMKVVIDDWSWKMKVDFTDKVGGAFATGGGQTGGKEHATISLLLFMINNRMVVAGPLYSDETGEDRWAEIGATAMTGPIDPGVNDRERDGAHRLGERVADLAMRLHGGG